MRTLFYPVFILGSLLCSWMACFGSTGVGNGGDIVSSYLERTRFAMRRALEIIADPETPEREKASLCESIPQLSELQKMECMNFIRQTASQYIALNTGENRTPFLIRSKPIEVPGPDGMPRPVSARTPLGPDGPIEFHLDSIKNYTPVQMLILLGHEFGHKVLFKGRYVEDNLPTTAFHSGRELLDSVGRGLADFATGRGLVGISYGIRDQFSCKIETGPASPSFQMIGLTPRLFFNRGSFDRFETTIGLNTNDLSVEIGETSTSRITLKAIFHEETGCRPDETSGRWTELALVRKSRNDAVSESETEEDLLRQKRDGWNPLCESGRVPFVVEYGNLRFSCTYLGVVADHQF